MPGGLEKGGASFPLLGRRDVTGLRWNQVHDDVLVVGAPAKTDTEAAWDLGATVAANLIED